MAGLNPTPKVEVLYAAKAAVAEGPYYEEETGNLLWVDIHKMTINFLNLDTGENRSLQFSETVSAVIPVEGSSKTLLALIDRKICLVDRTSGSVLEVLVAVEDDKPTNRFNDGKCDRSGRLWTGSMGQEESPGVLEPNQGLVYSYSSGTLKKYMPTSVSNGLDWSRENDVMYYIDSAPKKLYTFAYNGEEASLSNQAILIDYSKDDALGFPDGMCTDAEGRLWVASFCGQRVTCWDPKTKGKLLTVKIPGAKNITSCCFGGPNYEWLFVTSATYGLSEKEFAEYPNSGALFVIKDLGTRGFPANKFKN